VWVQCVCLFADESGGVLEWAVAVFQDSLQMSQAPLGPLSEGLPWELGLGASLISTTLFHNHLSLSLSQ